MKRKFLPLATTLSVALLATACSSSKPARSDADAPPARAEQSRDDARAAKEDARAAKQAAKAPTPPPAGSKLAKVSNGMTDTDVRRILGEPDSSKAYQTGKAWIPYYYGGDTARTEYIYKGLGRITMTRNRYTGGLSVIRVDYDPNL
jgi:hypothetical protein